VPTYGWVSDVEAEELWPDAAALDPDVLALLLTGAHEACVQFAPVPEPTPVPARYKLAQVSQAKAVYRSLVAGTDGTIGLDGQAVAVFPLDWNVKQHLRPARGRPLIG